MFTILKDVKGHKHTIGKYSVSERRVTFKDYRGEPSGMHAFTIRNGILTFSVDEDPCDPGVANIVGTWRAHSRSN